MGHAATAFASVVSAMFVDGRPMLEAIDRIAAPVLVLWGDQDERSTINDVLARRPRPGSAHPPIAGHAAPLEAPERYAEAVGRWLAPPAATEAHELEPDPGPEPRVPEKSTG
jgi:pimeloyl-ACP methyl ester carboxylesterase